MNSQTDLSAFLKHKTPLLTPFHPDLFVFCETFSQTLFKNCDAKVNPDYIALAFWLRKAHLLEMKKELPLHTFPKGLVFHIPPANIDVMLAYSWIVSLLMGNRNIIRIPGTRNSDQLIQLIFNLLSDEKFSQIQEMTHFIEYGHDEAITRKISLAADARLIWGGNQTVATIQKIPLKDGAIDITFPDRFSFSAIHAKSYIQLEDKKVLSLQFFNDMYWFDQTGCSSPRLIFWVGDPETIRLASQQFYQILQETTQEKHYQVSLGGVLLKKNHMMSQSLHLPVEQVIEFSNELSILYLKEATEQCRFHCGQGLLYHVNIEDLSEIAAFTTSKDQTLTTYGFTSEELKSLKKHIIRIVPIGQALNFTPQWDGHDLFHELTKTL